MTVNSIITLTSDLGNRDFYLGAVKGKIYKTNLNAHIVDLCIDCMPFDILEAAFNVRNAMKDFPDETIHLITVDDEFLIDFSFPEKNKIPCVMRYKNQYFVANDNGIFSLILGTDIPQSFWKIKGDLSQPEVVKFTSKEIMAPFVAELSKGVKLETLADLKTNFHRNNEIVASYEENEIVGHVVYIDGFGNLITNITQELFVSIGKNEPFTIFLRKKEYHIDTISTSYMDVPTGHSLAFFNGNNLLEIAIRNGATKTTGGASKLFGIKINNTIRIEFLPQGSKQNLNEIF
jgi:S-adenosylmethionine hydrolase